MIESAEQVDGGSNRLQAAVYLKIGNFCCAKRVQLRNVQSVIIEDIAQENGKGHTMVSELEEACVNPYLPYREIQHRRIRRRYFRVYCERNIIVSCKLTQFHLTQFRVKLMQLLHHYEHYEK